MDSGNGVNDGNGGNGGNVGKWAMGTEWISGLITISPYWMNTQLQANEFISRYYYRKSPDIKNVWYQQEGYETNRYTYSSSNDDKTEQERRRLAQVLMRS